jgi:hypothetical protein
MKYYKDNALFRFLRFLNLLEPEQNILSISKIFMWMMLFVLVFVLIYMPSDLSMVLSSIGAVVATMMNYSYRRWIQYQKSKGHEIHDDNNENSSRSWRSKSNDEYDVR